MTLWNFVEAQEKVKTPEPYTWSGPFMEVLRGIQISYKVEQADRN